MVASPQNAQMPLRRHGFGSRFFTVVVRDGGVLVGISAAGGSLYPPPGYTPEAGE